jgi:hypothetical protein
MYTYSTEWNIFHFHIYYMFINIQGSVLAINITTMFVSWNEV